MRPALGVLALLLSVGCSCSRSHVDDDGGAHQDGGVDDDAALPGDAEIIDGAIDGGGEPDPTTCEGYAEALCARFEACNAEIVWILGSRARCETFFGVQCEHEDTLERTGDLDAARVAFIESLSLSDCTWARGNANTWSEAQPAGTGAAGDACRSPLQCGDVITADGRTVRMHCYLPRGVDREPACDVGLCEVPLGEGTADCDEGSHTVNRCDASLGLDCFNTDDDPTFRCRVRSFLAEGETCPIDMPGLCVDGLVCGPTNVCERPRANGESCDPAVFAHCGGVQLPYCDPAARTCMQRDMAFDGEACGIGHREPTCGAYQECVDGICVVGARHHFRGETCANDAECWWPLGCADGVCGGQPCD